MIWVTRLDGTPLLLNDDHVLAIESMHDTILTLVNGDKLRVTESVPEITERVVHWRRRVAGVEGVVGALLHETEPE